MAGVVNTTDTFTTNQVITSTAMNNIIDQTLFTSDAIVSGNSTLALVSGKLKVGTITSNEMGVDSVTTNAIAANAVTTAKILDANVTTAKILDANVTTAKILDANVTTAKIADAAITAPKLNGAQTGTAPAFAARAFAKIKPNSTASARTAAFKSGNYSAAVGSVVTVTITSHGLRVDDRIRLVFTRTAGTGTVPSSSTFFTVTGVTDANIFTVAFTSAAVSSGTVIAEFILIQGSKNVSSASFYDSGSVRYILNFTESMNDVNYTTLVTSQLYPSAWNDVGNEDTLGETQLNTVRSCHVGTANASRFVNIVVFG
jgi:hypothetical protein